MTAPRPAAPLNSPPLRPAPPGPTWTRPVRAAGLAALLLTGAAHATGTQVAPTTPATVTGAACPADWRDLDPADLRAAQITATRLTFTDARGTDSRATAQRGALLLQGPATGGRRCSYFVPPTGMPDRVTRGFVLDTQVRAVPPTTELAGTWVRDANTGLTLTRADNGHWTLTGSLTVALPDGSVSSANLNGPLRPDAERWIYRDGRCEAQLHVVGSWLVAADNGRCAAPDVTFGGLYHHVR